MRLEMNLAFCVLVVLTGSSQARDHAGFSASPDPTEDSGKKVPQQIPDPAGGGKTSAEPTTVTEIEGTEASEAATDVAHTPAAEAAPTQHENAPVVMTALPGTVAPTAAAGSLSSTPTGQSTVAPRQVSPTEGGASLTRTPLATLSSQPAQDTEPTAHASTPPQSQSATTDATQAKTITGGALTSAPGRDPAGPTHLEVPSELNVGDEGIKGPHYSSLDPLLASLLSVFIVTTAIVFVVLFLKFRQRTNHPEFHRLQDLPMDDLMEDTPLSRYTY